MENHEEIHTEEHAQRIHTESNPCSGDQTGDAEAVLLHLQSTHSLPELIHGNMVKYSQIKE